MYHHGVCVVCDVSPVTPFVKSLSGVPYDGRDVRMGLRGCRTARGRRVVHSRLQEQLPQNESICFLLNRWKELVSNDPGDMHPV